MDVLGAHVKVSGNKFAAGFALVRDDAIEASWHFPAPRDADEGVQLGELHRFTVDLLQQQGGEEVAIKGTEAGSSAALRTAQHAEGAIMAAAGSAGTPCRVWTGQGYRGALGAQNNSQALQKAQRSLTGAWPKDSEVQQAAAAALAFVRKARG